MEKTELAIKVDSFRKIPSPYKAGQNSSITKECICKDRFFGTPNRNGSI